MGDKEKTLITFEEDVKINNIRLGAGTYGFYVYPVNNNDWQIIFSKDINGTVDQYDKVDDMLRVSVVPQEAPLQKDLKIGVENIEESTKEICRGGDCDNKKIIPVFSADLYLKWETRKILLNLKMTGELRGNGFYPKNLTFPEKVAPVWKIVKSSLTALVEIDDEGFTEHTRYFSDEFLSRIVKLLQKRKSKTIMSVRSVDGMDELSTTSNNKICLLKEGEITEFVLNPEEYNLQKGIISDTVSYTHLTLPTKA